MKVPIIETDRLILRPLTLEDAEAVFVWVSDERVTKYMPYTTYTNIEDVKEWLLNIQSVEDDFNFGIVVKDNNLLIGSCDIGYDAEKKAWDFGYNIRYDHWNHGFTTEAAKGMMNFVYKNFGARWFSSNHAIENIASGKVIEKCGLHFDHYGEISKFDVSQKFKAKFYRGYIETIG